jgi:threonine synthase
VRWAGTRDRTAIVSFGEALLRPLPPGGGLWIPHTVPRWPDWADLLTLDWTDRCVILAGRLLREEVESGMLAEGALERAVRQALDFPIPLVEVGAPGCGLYSCELFHGPTLAFKDVGARFFAALLELCLGEDAGREPRGSSGGRRFTVLTATSGDTGAAVAHALWRRPGVRVVVLYPAGARGRISRLQELQLTTLGENVAALAVDASFDDCQALAKAAFADPGLAARHRLTSANSINVGRLLPQTFYYAEIAAQLRRRSPAGRPAEDPPLVVAVPSGNFGNLYAGLLARALGVPIARFVAATNANTTVPEYLESGVYRPRPSRPTLSNAMDVGAPSNWERIEALVNGDLEALRTVLRWGWKNDAETEGSIRRLYEDGYLADPHGAVAAAVLRDRLEPGETGVFLATAHPAKFLPVYERLGIAVPLPEALARLERQGKEEGPSRRIANDFAALRRFLDEG